MSNRSIENSASQATLPQSISIIEEKSALLGDNMMDQKYKIEIINRLLNSPHSEYKSKSKVGFLKEGFYHLRGINPIDRYNFIIDRYHETLNIVDNIRLIRIPSRKIIGRLYDIYTWIYRMILAVFMVIIYYCYKYQYKKKSLAWYRVGVFTYRRYILSDGDLANGNDSKISGTLLLLGIILFVISCYVIIIFTFIMIIPNVCIMIYLLMSLVIHKMNQKKVRNIFQNMIYDPSLDEKGQLNDYILVDPNTIGYYHLFSYYHKLVAMLDSRAHEGVQVFMLYGDLFEKEYNILISAFTRQVLAIIVVCVIALIYYF